MLHFIPAWYQHNTWSENEQNWHVRRMQTEFDDTVKQIQLFHRSKAYPYQIMLLSFSPNLRHFLHRQSVYRAPYWSCFDAIQEIRRKKVFVLSYHNLNWPKNIEFMYTPFVAVAMLNGEKYAQIEFGEDGNPIEITLYEKGIVHRKNIYDDRGFLSATIVYEGLTPHYEDYLCENGTWKMRYFYADGHVEINPKVPNYLIQHGDKEKSIPFEHSIYPSMDAVIEEVVTSYLKWMDIDDIYCVALHDRHNAILQKTLGGRKLIFSLYGDRYNPVLAENGIKTLRTAKYIVTDSSVNERKVRDLLGKGQGNIISISPYDTRVDAGISQQLSVQNILIPVDGMIEENFCAVIQSIASYLPMNNNARVCLFTRQAEYDRKRQLLAKTRVFLRNGGFEENWAIETRNNEIAENDVDEDGIPVKFYVEQCVDELSVSRCMREQRLVVDLRLNLDIYLQVAALSMGIPQIVRNSTEFVRNGKNGIVTQEIQKLPGLLHYYLDGLSNWNEALVNSREISKEHTTGKLLERWKGVIDHVG